MRTCSLWILISLTLPALAVIPGSDDPPRSIDPSAWGQDHVGQDFPAYITGDECLFCHRDIGATWNSNRHQLTIRLAESADPAVKALMQVADEQAQETAYLLGSRRATRYLKRGDAYGKLDVLSASYRPPVAHREGDGAASAIGELRQAEHPQWDGKKFGARCAGCHCTAVDSAAQAFASLSLDCFTCHGDVPLSHTTDPRQALLSAQNRSPRQVISLCSQCHLRGGTAKSSGLPYPNTFVPGDNLFRDFQVDLSREAIQKLDVADQHVFLSARAVVVEGQTHLDCLACHDVHTQRTDKHQRLPDSVLCAACHLPGTDHAELLESWRAENRLRVTHRVCEY